MGHYVENTVLNTCILKRITSPTFPSLLSPKVHINLAWPNLASPTGPAGSWSALQFFSSSLTFMIRSECSTRIKAPPCFMLLIFSIWLLLQRSRQDEMVLDGAPEGFPATHHHLPAQYEPPVLSHFKKYLLSKLFMCVFFTFHLNSHASLGEVQNRFQTCFETVEPCSSPSPTMSCCSYLSLLELVTSSRCSVSLLRDTVCVCVCVVDTSERIKDITDHAIIFPVCSLGKCSVLVQHPRWPEGLSHGNRWRFYLC